MKEKLRSIETEHEEYAQEHGTDSSQFKIHQNMHGMLLRGAQSARCLSST